MAATVRVRLGEREFEVHRFNIGQVEELMEIWATPNIRRHPFEILRLALARCGLSAEDVKGIDVEVDELTAAVKAILRHSGFVMKDEAPPNVVPPVQPSGAGGSGAATDQASG